MAHMNIMWEAWRPCALWWWQASTCLFPFPPSFIIQLLTVMMKHDQIGQTDTLASRADLFCLLCLPTFLCSLASSSPASELWWQYLYFESPRAGEVHPAVATGWLGCNTFSQPGNRLGGTSTFSCSSCGAWGVICSLMGAASSMGTSSIGALVGAGWTSMEAVNLAWLLKNPSSRAMPSKTMSLENEMYFP